MGVGMFFMCVGLMGTALMARVTPAPQGVERRALAIQAVLDALAAARMTHKEAQYFMGLTKSQWSRSVDPHGDLHLSMVRLAAMPLMFQTEFLARYAFLVIRQAAIDVAEDLRTTQKQSA